MRNTTNSARALLDATYDQLHFDEGGLLNATAKPVNLTSEQWIEKGEWLSLAEKAGAEKVFFIDNNPVIVFAETEAKDRDSFRELFNKVWNMARPMLLFIARQGELAVYSLAHPPIRTAEEWHRTKPLEIVRNVYEVATLLHEYRREQVESGRLFEDARFGGLDQRADKSLIRDLKIIRSELQAEGLDKDNLKYAHALIGRSIFIRYLEDRRILMKQYFDEVAGNNARWRSLLDAQLSSPTVDSETSGAIFPRLLADKDFTYALFDRLAHDFNGDMFPSDTRERSVVQSKHLTLLRDFLLGNVGSQKKLFFWAYKFNIIPLELISSIYEEFYHTETGSSDRKGTHYTPSSLVELVLSSVLTPERLETNPRILDPACGSGIFLVEAFRRIVRYNIQKRNGRGLNHRELRKILRNQIAGIEVNDEAVRVAAFSLYLSLLHYQEPPDILEQIERGRRLPNLKYQPDAPNDGFHFNNLLHANTFKVNVCATTRKGHFPFMEAEGVDHVPVVREPFDIIVGNPPWGATDESGTALKWCRARDNPVGDGELSQAFVWKTLDLLKDGGYAGLLLSTGVFFKRHPHSQAFRRKWLKQAKLLEVINFAHVRDIFFNKGVAPFASVVFQKKSIENGDHPVRYWSAKKTAQAMRLQAVILNRYDLRLVPQEELMRDDRSWKIYWWGNHGDRSLIDWLETNAPLDQLNHEGRSRIIKGQGFKKAKKDKMPSGWLRRYRQFPTECFERYGPLDVTKLLPVPREVHRRGVRELYDDDRILIKRGISQGQTNQGQIVARMESIPFCFLNSIHGIKLRDAEASEYKVLLAIFWSSLARYYYFLTSSAWGMWHYELHLGEILQMPIRFPTKLPLRNRIVSVVNQLRSWNPPRYDIFNPTSRSKDETKAELAALERELDEAIFDLYELSQPERDQIRDLCDTGIEFFYNHYRSEAVKPLETTRPTMVQGLIKDIPERQIQAGLEGYIQVFLEIWNNQFEGDAEFSWHIIRPSGDWPLLAIVFSPTQKGKPLRSTIHEQAAWVEVMHKLENQILTPYKTRRIYIDGMVRAFSETGIIIIKRNERRLWTRSMAREDADAVMVQAMNQQRITQGAH
jgi:hypothetical protein